MHEFAAKVKRIIDGDTLVLWLDRSFGDWSVKTLRLYGINTPETRGPERPEGLRVKRIVAERLRGRRIMVRTIKTKKGADKQGKYGRYLAQIDYLADDETWHNLNRELVKEGLAKAVNY